MPRARAPTPVKAVLRRLHPVRCRSRGHERGRTERGGFGIAVDDSAVTVHNRGGVLLSYDGSLLLWREHAVRDGPLAVLVAEERPPLPVQGLRNGNVVGCDAGIGANLGVWVPKRCVSI